MATLAEAVSPDPRAKPAVRPRFYLWLSLVCLVVGVGGFSFTYWLQVPAGTFSGTPLMHIHALLPPSTPVRAKHDDYRARIMEEGELDDKPILKSSTLRDRTA